MDGRGEFQLLPGTKKRLGIRIPGENRFLYIGSAILGAVLVTSFAFGSYQKSLEDQIAAVDAQILEIERTRDKKAEQDIVMLRLRLETVKKLIDEHIYWTEAISHLTNLIQREVQLSSFNGEAGKGEIAIKGRALTYTVLARQIASFLADEGITDLTLGSISPTLQGDIEFNISLKIDNNKFLFKK